MPQNQNERNKKGSDKMKVDRAKLELAMARACMNSGDLPAAAGLPRATVQNAVVGKNVRPATAGHIAKALGVDVLEILEEVN